MNRRRDLWQIIRDSVRFYAWNWSMLGVSLIALPLWFADGYAIRTLQHWLTRSLGDRIGSFPFYFAYRWIIAPLSMPIGVAQAGSLLTIVKARDLGRSMQASALYISSRTWARPLLAAWLRRWFIIVLLGASVVGIPWAIYYSTRWQFIDQAVIFDGVPGRGALEYSSDVVSIHWWQTFGRTLAIEFILVLPWLFAPPVIAIGVYAGFYTSAFRLIYRLGSAFLSSLVAPLDVISKTLMFFDLKLRKESGEPPTKPDEDPRPPPRTSLLSPQEALMLRRTNY